MDILRRRWRYMYLYMEVAYSRAWLSLGTWTFVRPVSALSIDGVHEWELTGSVGAFGGAVCMSRGLIFSVILSFMDSLSLMTLSAYPRLSHLERCNYYRACIYSGIYHIDRLKQALLVLGHTQSEPSDLRTSRSMSTVVSAHSRPSSLASQ